MSIPDGSGSWCKACGQHIGTGLCKCPPRPMVRNRFGFTKAEWIQVGYGIVYSAIFYCIAMLWLGLPQFVLIGVGAALAVLGLTEDCEKGEDW